MDLASNRMSRDRNHDNGRKHENAGGHDRAWRKPRDAANPVTGRAAVAQPGAEADQKAGGGNHDETRGQLRNGDRVTQLARRSTALRSAPRRRSPARRDRMKA